MLFDVLTTEYNKARNAIKAKCKRVLKNLTNKAKKVMDNRYASTRKTRATLEKSKEELTKIFASILENSQFVVHNTISDQQPVHKQAEQLESRLEAIDAKTKQQVATLRKAYRQKVEDLENTKLDLIGLNFEADPKNIKTQLSRLDGEYKIKCLKVENEHKEKLGMLEDQLKLALQGARELMDSCRPHTEDEQTPGDNTDMRQATETLQQMSRQITTALGDPLRTQNLAPAMRGTHESDLAKQQMVEQTAQIVDSMEDSTSPPASQQMATEQTTLIQESSVKEETQATQQISTEPPAQILDNSTEESTYPLVTQQVAVDPPGLAQGLESMGEMQESLAIEQMTTEPFAKMNGMREMQGSAKPLATQQMTEPVAQVLDNSTEETHKSISSPAMQQMTEEPPARDNSVEIQERTSPLATQQMIADPPRHTQVLESTRQMQENIVTQQMTTEPSAQVQDNSVNETQDNIFTVDTQQVTVDQPVQVNSMDEPPGQDNSMDEPPVQDNSVDEPPVQVNSMDEPQESVSPQAIQQTTVKQSPQNSTVRTHDTAPYTEVHNTTVAPDTTQVSSTTGSNSPSTSNSNTLEDRINSLEKRQEITENVLAAACCVGIGIGGIGLVVLGPTIPAGCVIGLCCFGVCWYILKKR